MAGFFSSLMQISRIRAGLEASESGPQSPDPVNPPLKSGTAPIDVDAECSVRPPAPAAALEEGQAVSKDDKPILSTETSRDEQDASIDIGEDRAIEPVTLPKPVGQVPPPRTEPEIVEKEACIYREPDEGSIQEKVDVSEKGDKQHEVRDVIEQRSVETEKTRYSTRPPTSEQPDLIEKNTKPDIIEPPRTESKIVEKKAYVYREPDEGSIQEKVDVSEKGDKQHEVRDVIEQRSMEMEKTHYSAPTRTLMHPDLIEEETISDLIESQREQRSSSLETKEWLASSPRKQTKEPWPALDKTPSESLRTETLLPKPEFPPYLFGEPQLARIPDPGEIKDFSLSIGTISVSVEQPSPEPARKTISVIKQPVSAMENLSNRISRRHIRIR
jgi:hypothetical protein